MIKEAELTELEKAAGLAVLLWPENTVKDLVDEFSEILSTGKGSFFLKYVQDEPVGFAQCQLREDYVEGTSASPVGYLEGIFVKEGYRRSGYARELLCACEKWAKKMGCREFASDCELDNHGSFAFHMALGFTEANRVICFTKQL